MLLLCQFVTVSDLSLQEGLKVSGGTEILHVSSMLLSMYKLMCFKVTV